MGQLVAGAVGAVVGFYVGGPAGAQMGFAAGSALYAVTQPGPHSEGPKLSDLKVTGTDYGQAIPYIFGHPRISGQIVYSSSKREVATTTTEGKGGGPSYTEYTYEVDVLILLTDNEIEGQARIWDNGKLIWSNLIGASSETLSASASSPRWDRMTFYGGASDQLPDPTYEAAVGIGRAPAYRGRGSVFIEGLKLGTSGQLPNLTFEVARRATTGAGAFFDIPFDDGTYDDVAPDPMTPSSTGETHLISYPSVPPYEGFAFFENDLVNNDAPRLAWEGGKLSDMSIGGKFTIECRVIVAGVQGTGTGNNYEFMGATGPGYQATFGFRVVSGAVVLSSNVYSGTTDQQFHGSPTSDIFRIVWGEDAGVIRFYCGDILLRESSTTIAYERLFIGTGSPQSNNVPTGYFFDYFRGYFGDSPVATVTLLDEDLDDVVAELMDRCGYESSEFDVTELSSITKPVRSLSVASIGATRATLELLMQSYYFDCVLSDKLYFRPRVLSPLTTIEWDELGASNSPEGDPDPLTIKYRNELEVPAQIALSYINVTNDYQTGTEFSDRAISSQSSTRGVNLGIGMTPAEAKGVADAFVLDNYASLAGTSLKIPFTRNEIEPTDVLTVNGDGESYRMRVVRKNDSGGILELEVVVDDVNALISAQITDEDYIPQTEVQEIAGTLWEPLDVPLLRDADNVPGWYVGAKRDSNGSLWPGAGIFRSWDGVSFDQVATFTSESVFGYATTTLGDWDGGNVFDELNSVTVDVGLGQLSSSTRSAMLSDLTINVMLIGSEVIRFRTATMLSAGVYTLSGLIRGFRGTYWAMTDHGDQERAVLLNVPGLRTVQTEAAQIGVERDVVGVTFNRPLSSATPEPFTDTGIRLKPFAPTDFRVERDGSDDITATWKRMTRLSFRFLTEGIDPPLGEATELYDAEIYDDDTYANVVRTFASLTVPEFDYSAAEQTTDFGSPQATIYARIYQRSAIVGRGYALEGHG
jgi:hypothetical protein